MELLKLMILLMIFDDDVIVDKDDGEVDILNKIF